MRMVQNFLLIWLDANNNDSNQDFQRSRTILRRIIKRIDIFVHRDQCLDFIRSIEKIQIFLIISGVLGQSLVPEIHDQSEIEYIYIFCGNKAKHQQWSNVWPKIRGVFTDIDKICEILKTDAEIFEQITTPINMTSNDLNHLEPNFMYTQLMKESTTQNEL